MYSENLEKLIEMALADGVLTEKEKQVLLKNAVAEGIDLDEFEMILEARLYEKTQKQDNKKTSVASQSNKLGDVRKCPACGSIIQSFQTVCNDCGYEFRNVNANSAVATLSEKLENVGKEYDKRISETKNKKVLSSLLRDKEDTILERQIEIIMNFPIPNTREDILELLHFIYPKTKLKTDDTDDKQDAWNNKFDEIINRAKIAYSNDSKMLSEISKYEQQFKRRQKTKKLSSIFLIVFIVLGIGVYYFIFHNSEQSEGYLQEKNRLELILDNVNTAIKNHNLDEAEIMANQLIWEYNSSLTDYKEEKKLWNEKRKGIINTIRESKGLEPLKEEEKTLLDTFKDKIKESI
jgi:hypothetical protein